MSSGLAPFCSSISQTARPAPCAAACRGVVCGPGPEAGARVALLVAYAIGFFGLALVLTRRRLRA